MFALCYGPHALLALLWSGLLLPSFRRRGRPQSLRRISLHGSSFITIAGSSPAGLAALWAAVEIGQFAAWTLAQTLARTVLAVFSATEAGEAMLSQAELETEQREPGMDLLTRIVLMLRALDESSSG